MDANTRAHAFFGEHSKLNNKDSPTFLNFNPVLNIGQKIERFFGEGDSDPDLKTPPPTPSFVGSLLFMLNICLFLLILHQRSLKFSTSVHLS